MVTESSKRISVRVYRVLVVDDDETLLDAVARALRAAGQQVVPCETFEQGREALRQQAFDVLITDVRLGASNGLQLAIVARQMNPAIRLIVFSGFDDPVLRAEAGKIDARYLVKPVTAAKLLSLIYGIDA
jgi:DNA-binding response OmpR family regulator